MPSVSATVVEEGLEVEALTEIICEGECAHPAGPVLNEPERTEKEETEGTRVAFTKDGLLLLFLKDEDDDNNRLFNFSEQELEAIPGFDKLNLFFLRSVDSREELKRE